MRASLVAQMVKNAYKAEDPSSIPGSGRSPKEGNSNPVFLISPVFLPGESPWTEEPGRLQSMGLQRTGCD